MPSLNLVKSDDPILKECAKYVYEDDEEMLKRLVHGMLKVMRTTKALGLAAPQVGVSKRVFLVRMDITDERTGKQPVIRTFINPSLLSKSEETVVSHESCLSFPGKSVIMSRAKEVVVEYSNMKGETIEKTLTGRDARVFQHEFDHLNGVTII